MKKTSVPAPSLLRASRRTWRAASLTTAGIGLLVLTAGSALAQDNAGSDAQSFASAFFISRRAIGNEWQIELLGSLIIWLLLALSMLSIGLIGHMALTNQRKSILPEGVLREAGELLRAGKFKEAVALVTQDQSFFSRVLSAGLSEAPHGYGAMIRSLELTSDQHTTERLRRIEYLNVLGQVAPMIGLFGTVYGMILAFYSIVSAGGDANPVQLAGGIGTALVTTFWGLIVAIPALAGYAIVRNKIDALTAEATQAAEELLNQFRPRRATTTGGSDAKPTT